MVNIVMLVKDRLALTTQAVESLYSHTDEKTFTLTCIDDGSDVLTRRYLSGIDRENYTLIRVEQSHSVLSQLKNLGVAWTQQRFPQFRNGWLYLSDNDVYFMENWLERLTGVAEVNERNGFRLFGGQVHPFHKPTGPGWPRLDQMDVLDGPSWLMRWPTWNQFGPLSRLTAPGVCQSEEYPFCKALRQSGYRIGVVKPHVVVHTGLTNTYGQPAPGAEERRKMIPDGVYAE